MTTGNASVVRKLGAPVACAQTSPSAPSPPPPKKKGLGERASVHRLGLQKNEMVQTKGVRHVIP